MNKIEVEQQWLYKNDWIIGTKTLVLYPSNRLTFYSNYCITGHDSPIFEKEEAFQFPAGFFQKMLKTFAPKFLEKEEIEGHKSFEEDPVYFAETTCAYSFSNFLLVTSFWLENPALAWKALQEWGKGKFWNNGDFTDSLPANSTHEHLPGEILSEITGKMPRDHPLVIELDESIEPDSLVVVVNANLYEFPASNESRSLTLTRFKSERQALLIALKQGNGFFFYELPSTVKKVYIDSLADDASNRLYFARFFDLNNQSMAPLAQHTFKAD